MRFKNIYCEITNVCNLSCSFCKKTKRTPQFISVQNFAEVIAKIKGYTTQICLHILGEPLLHPNFDQLLEICDENKIKVNLVSNGTLIGKINTNTKLRKVSFSLHSFPIEKYGEDFLPELKIYLEKICKFTESFDGISELRLWNKDNDLGLNQLILDYLSQFYKTEILLITQKIKERLYLGVASPFVWPALSEPLCSGNYCYGLKHQIGILVDGTVVPCCLDGEGVINLGNIYQDSLSDIINSKKARNMIDGFANRTLTEELCKHCQYIERFNVL